MKVWITKYALSRGIIVADARQSEGVAGLVAVGYSYYHGEGKDWHRTIESDQAKADAMRLAKIASLRKSIARLEKLSFKTAAIAEE